MKLWSVYKGVLAIQGKERGVWRDELLGREGFKACWWKESYRAYLLNAVVPNERFACKCFLTQSLDQVVIADRRAANSPYLP
jgi:hypothetical protein